MLFADDTLIFCGTDVEQFRNMRRLLLHFEAISRMKINLGKFEAITVGEVDNVEELVAILGCRVAQLPMIYFEHLLEARFNTS